MLIVEFLSVLPIMLRSFLVPTGLKALDTDVLARFYLLPLQTLTLLGLVSLLSPFLFFRYALYAADSN